jgi:NinG protein
MKRKRPLKALRRELDAKFSEFIRRRDANEWGEVRCVTCGRSSHWKDMHAGHFIKRQHLATRYDERNSHPQDAYCNTYRGGALIEYTLYMLERYGQGTIDELMRLKRTTVRFRRDDYERMIERFS